MKKRSYLSALAFCFGAAVLPASASTVTVDFTGHVSFQSFIGLDESGWGNFDPVSWGWDLQDAFNPETEVHFKFIYDSELQSSYPGSSVSYYTPIKSVIDFGFAQITQENSGLLVQNNDYWVNEADALSFGVNSTQTIQYGNNGYRFTGAGLWIQDRSYTALIDSTLPISQDSFDRFWGGSIWTQFSLNFTDMLAPIIVNWGGGVQSEDYSHNMDVRGWLEKPVVTVDAPEPNALILLLLGVFGLVLRARKN